MLTPIDGQLGAYTTAFMTIILGVGKVVQMWKASRSENLTERQKADDAMWSRRDQMMDDLRADVERFRGLLRERDSECDDLKKERDEAFRQRDECWELQNRRRVPRAPRTSGPATAS